jgi:hypothetical protein
VRCLRKNLKRESHPNGDFAFEAGSYGNNLRTFSFSIIAALMPGALPPSMVDGQLVNRWTAAEQLRSAGLLEPTDEGQLEDAIKSGSIAFSPAAMKCWTRNCARCSPIASTNPRRLFK